MSKKNRIIIGAGPAGYVAAIRAAQLGAEVILIEKEEVGGTCLNQGCIPTKSLLASIEVLNLARRGEEFGLEIGKIKPDFSRMMERKNKIVSQLREGVHYLLKTKGVKLIRGRASFLNFHRIKVETEEGREEIEGEKIIIATGSRPLPLPGIDFNQPEVLTSKETLELKEVPKSLLIIGAGVIGCEFASLFRALGTEITLVEMMDEILPAEDKGIARVLRQIFQKQGIKIFTHTRLAGITHYQKNGLIAKLDNGEEIETEKILVCIGREPNTEALGLENLDLKIDQKGHIKVNEKMEASPEGIYAAGDVVGEFLLAYVAFKEGIVAAENALGLNSRIDYMAVPNCIFTLPQIGTVGLTADKAKEAGLKVKVGRFPFSASGKALCLGETRGFTQIVFEEETGEIMGGQIIGPHACDLIHEIALAMRWELTIEEIGNTTHAHPTLSEAVMEAARSAWGRPIHGHSY